MRTRLLVGFLTFLPGPLLADIPAACAEAPSFAAAIAALEARDWQVQPRDAQLTDAQTTALAWTLMIPYITGDSGGETPETLLDLQRRSAPGLLVRRDTDTTRSRVLLADEAALTITQTRTIPGRVERVCRLSTDADAPDGVTPIDTDGFEDAPATLAQIITILPEE